MEARLPHKNFIRLKSTITEWVGRKNATLKDWNRVSLFKLANKDTPADATIQTDMSGSWGCGAFLNNIKWFQWEWP